MAPKFPCPVCKKEFSSNRTVRRHERTVHGVGSAHQCDQCPTSFSRLDSLTRHIRSTHTGPTFSCPSCTKCYYNEDNLKNHIESGICQAGSSQSLSSCDRFKLYESSFNCRLTTYIAFGSQDDKDIPSFLSVLREEIKTLLVKNLDEHRSIKFNVVLTAEYENPLGESSQFTFATCNRPLLTEVEVDSSITEIVDHIIKKEEDTNMSKSGWALKRIVFIELRINKYEPLRASSYLPLPKCIVKRKAVINVQNFDDERCLYYAMMSKFLPEGLKNYNKNSFRYIPTLYDFRGITFPATLQDAINLERNNPFCSINVYSFIRENTGKSKSVVFYPLHMTKHETEGHTDLLFYSDGVKSHWVWIKNLSRLVRSQVSNHSEDKLFCKRCLTFVGQQGKTSPAELMDNHKTLCYSKPLAGVVMPEPNSAFIRFQNFSKINPVPVCIYADLESILRQIHSCRPNPDRPYSLKYQLHEVALIGAYVYVDERTMTDEVRALYPRGVQIFEGSEAVKQFLEFLQEISRITITLYSRNRPLVWTALDRDNYSSATDCYFCRTPLGTDVCADHCHITGKYRGAAHCKCNLNASGISFLPVFFHNLGGYDAHFLIKELGFDTSEISVIPNSSEKYISFSKQMGVIKRGNRSDPFRVRFVDTYRLMPSSLDKMTSLLTYNQFRLTASEFPNNTSLVTKKGVMCYEYLKDQNVLQETCLPEKDKFYSSLSQSGISDAEYNHAQLVWSTFQCQTLHDYVVIYLKSDVTILADAFQAFREVCTDAYQLDAANYLTAPSLTWDAMLKFTGVTLELLTDYEMLMMVEAGIRGGLAVCTRRHARANNKYLPDYDETQDSSYITSVDANNLYGWAMTQQLPRGGFEWVQNPGTITLQTLQNLDSDFGYFLEVDVDIPTDLHDKHNDFPFLPESIIPPGGTQPKLMATLNSKKKYVVHHAALRQALEHGLDLKKVYRVLKFSQSRWLAPYIELNTSRRAAATSDFEKDFWKLMSNAIFGKSMENIRKRMNFRLVCNVRSLQRYINRPSFKDRVIYGENLVGVVMRKEKMFFNRPVYVGAAILDISKTLNYNFHYDVLTPLFGEDKIHLLYQDTDSLTYHVQTDDIFNDFKTIATDYLDTSDYPPDHHSNLFNNSNKKVVGKWKDELSGLLVTEFVGLRAKMYAYQIQTDQQTQTKKRAKGVKQSTLKNNITFTDYLDVLNNQTELYHRQTFIRSDSHSIFTIEINKKTLSGRDDKRLICSDGVSTMAHGHYKLLNKDDSITMDE